MDKAFDQASVVKTLWRMVKTGYCSVEDLDTESQTSAYFREQAKRYVPVSDHGTACFMKPHRNLLREHPDEPIHEIKVTEERDFPASSRSEPSVSRERSQILLPETQEDSSAISVDSLPW